MDARLQEPREPSTLPYRLMALEAVALILVCLYYYSRLPQKLATHFGAGGAANGWMDKGGFLVFYLGLCAFMVAIFLLMPRFVALFPDSMINLPNKEYWLAPERRALTMGMMGENMAWLGVLVLALFIGMGYLTFQADLMPQPHLDEAAGAVMMGAFFVCMIIWLVRFIRAFSKKEPPRV